MRMFAAVAAAAALVGVGVFGLAKHTDNPAPGVGDGEYKIGADITAGRWHTDGTRKLNSYNGDVQQTDRCMWSIRLPASSQGAPVAQRDYSGPTDLTIGPVGAVFSTLGCKPWHPV